MESINLKNFNINKFTLFKMINHNTLKIKFKEKILKEEFIDFLDKNLKHYKLKSKAIDSQRFYIDLKNSFTYQWVKNYSVAEEITNLINKKFYSLESLNNDEIFEFKSLLSEKLKNNGKITIEKKIVMWIAIPIMSFIFGSKIYYDFISDERFLTEDDRWYCYTIINPKLGYSKILSERSLYYSLKEDCYKDMIAKRKLLKK